MTNEQKRSIAISIRISPEELEMLEKLTEAKHQTKTAVIISALQLYAQSLTAADTNPAEISPAQNNRQPTGAETAPATEDPTKATTTTETPEEINTSPRAEDNNKPIQATTSPAEARKAATAEIIAPSPSTPETSAENTTEASTEGQQTASPKNNPKKISTTTSASPEEIERLKRAAFLDGMETARRYFRHGQRHGRQARRRVKAAPAPKK